MSRPPGRGSNSTGPGCQCAADLLRYPLNSTSDSQGWPSLPTRRGLERALYEKQWPGAAEVLEDSQKQRIIAMVCSEPPEGRARWTVRLVVEEAVKRKLGPRVGRETIRILLLHHDLKPWRETNVVRGRPR